MKKKGFLIAAAAAAAVCGAAAFVLLREDPKETVIRAFEGVCAEGQTNPCEELFGLSQFAEGKKTDWESGLTVKLDGCSEDEIDRFSGAGLRFAAASDNETDGETGKAALTAEMAVVYNGMDVASLNAWFSERILLVTLPQLFDDVLSLDLGDGLADRLKQSPTVGPLLEEANLDADALAEYFDELFESSEAREGETSFDVAALLNRYREGCEAQKNFKEALTVEKADPGTFTTDGKEESCRGYTVEISKDALVDFLRDSSDFFLQDEELREHYLRQMEAAVHLTELMGGTLSQTASELQEEQYGEAKQDVDEVISRLDESLSDIHMTVYVTKEGALAAFSGTADVTVTDEDSGEAETTNVNFDVAILGGAYRTQNASVRMDLTHNGETESISLEKTGSYDGKSLASALVLEVEGEGSETYRISFDGDYQSEDGGFELKLHMNQGETELGSLSFAGTVDELEKGSSIRVNVDQAECRADDVSMTFSGEYYFRPLSQALQAPEGERMDVLTSSEDDWSRLMMQTVFSLIAMAGQLGIPLE